MLIVPQDEDESFFNGVEPFTVALLLYVIINYPYTSFSYCYWVKICVCNLWSSVTC